MSGWSEYPDAMIAAVNRQIIATQRIPPPRPYAPRPDDPEIRIWRQFAEHVFGEPLGMPELADALRAAAVPRAENWSWPRRPAGMAPSGRAEPVRAAFCHFLETGEPYFREETQ